MGIKGERCPQCHDSMRAAHTKLVHRIVYMFTCNTCGCVLEGGWYFVEVK